MNGVPRSSYDEVPYNRNAFAQSHPDRLATLATLFGMNPAPIDRCRVLELGCGSGGNMLPMACSLPGSQFLGIELSARQVADGRGTIDAMSLKNAEIRKLDILKVTKRTGVFDYVIAHGVYSWVPGKVQDKILDICRENLAPDGVAYVSYNTYPGWHFRGMIRDMMLYHANQFAEPSQRIDQARMLLGFLARSANKPGPYATILNDELELLRDHSDAYLFHDHLEDVNEPVYFREFAARANRHGLQYLGEADYSSMQAAGFAPEVAESLRQISSEEIRTEQYMDFLRNRVFRQTLLCRKELAPKRIAAPRAVARLNVASAARPVSEQVDVHSPRTEEFRLPNGLSFTTANSLAKAAFLHLSEIWPQSVSFDGLVKAACGRIGLDASRRESALSADIEALSAQILEGYGCNFVTLRTQQASFVTRVGERPVASALARHQARAGDTVTNQLHESGGLGPLARHILQLLDGNNDRDAIVSQLAELVENGVLPPPAAGNGTFTAQALRNSLAQTVDDNLHQFARLALLTG